MDSFGVTESISAVVGRVSDTTTTTLNIKVHSNPFFVSPEVLGILFIAMAVLPIIFFSHEIWRKWRIKNEIK